MASNATQETQPGWQGRGEQHAASTGVYSCTGGTWRGASTHTGACDALSNSNRVAQRDAVKEQHENSQAHGQTGMQRQECKGRTTRTRTIKDEDTNGSGAPQSVKLQVWRSQWPLTTLDRTGLGGAWHAMATAEAGQATHHATDGDRGCRGMWRLGDQVLSVAETGRKTGRRRKTRSSDATRSAPTRLLAIRDAVVCVPVSGGNEWDDGGLHRCVKLVAGALWCLVARCCSLPVTRCP